jgi:hypothetical protein
VRISWPILKKFDFATIGIVMLSVGMGDWKLGSREKLGAGLDAAKLLLTYKNRNATLWWALVPPGYGFSGRTS